MQNRRTYIIRDTLYLEMISVILLYNSEEEYYMPLLSSSGNHFVHPDSVRLLLKEFPLYMDQSSTKKVDTMTKELSKKLYKSTSITDSYKNHKFRLYNIGHYILKDLQEIAENYDIPIYSITELKSKKKKLKPKTKKELYSLIKERYDG